MINIHEAILDAIAESHSRCLEPKFVYVGHKEEQILADEIRLICDYDFSVNGAKFSGLEVVTVNRGTFFKVG